MGNVKVVLQFGKSTKFLEPNGWIDGVINDGTLGDLKSMVPSIQKMLPKLDSILGSVNTLLGDPALQSSVHNIDKITANLTYFYRELNTLLAQVNGSLPVVAAKAGRVMGQCQRHDGKRKQRRYRGSWGYPWRKYDDVNLNNKVNGLDVEATMAKVNATLDNMNSLTAKLNSNEGTMGLMLNDASLYNNLNSTMRSADSLLTNLKAHPKRYVHFSLFGRKDK